MTGYPYSEFDGGEDAADDREARFLARRAFVDGVELDARRARRRGAVVTRRFAPVPEADRRRARRWLPVVRAIAAAHAPKEANR